MGLKIKSTKGFGHNRMKFLIYGESGAGKTTLAGTLPDEKVLVLSSESGLMSINDKDVDYVQICGFNSRPDGAHADSATLIDAYKFLATDDHGYTAVVIDSYTDIMEMLLDEGKATLKTNSGAVDVMGAYGNVAERGHKALKLFRDLPMHVFVLALQERVEDADTGQTGYSASFPGKNLQQRAPQLFDEVFCIITAPTAEDPDRRVILCKPWKAYKCKDRSRTLGASELPNLGAIVAKIRSGVVATPDKAPKKKA